MKAVIALGSLVLLSFAAGCSSNPGSTSDSSLSSVTPDQIRRKRVTLFYEKGSDIPYTGAVVDYYPSGEKKLSTHFKDGLSVGPSLQWDRSGQMSHEGRSSNPGSTSDSFLSSVTPDQIRRKRVTLFYEKGSDIPYTGAVVDYYPRGAKKLSAHFKDGLSVGPSLQWYRSGQLSHEEDLDSNRTGRVTEWYENGQLKSERSLLNGGVNGFSTAWHPNGQKRIEENYLVEGRPKDGTSTKWYANGQKSSETRWADGQNRCSAEWDEAGNKESHFGYGCGCEIVARDARQKVSIEDVSIGVLPFHNGPPRSEHLALLNSIDDSIIHELAGRGAKAEARQARAPCGVEYVLEGSAMSRSDELQLSLSLIRVSDGSRIWSTRSEFFKRPLAELPVILQEIGEQITDALAAQWGE